MIETGCLIGFDGRAVHWHEPPGRGSASLPDDRGLWERFWESRGSVYGFAHSHPGSGTPCPSHEDETTFAAIESALGRRLLWWITTSDVLVMVTWCGPGKHDYVGFIDKHHHQWLDELRSRTGYGKLTDEWTTRFKSNPPPPRRF